MTERHWWDIEYSVGPEWKVEAGLELLTYNSLEPLEGLSGRKETENDFTARAVGPPK